MPDLQAQAITSANPEGAQTVLPANGEQGGQVQSTNTATTAQQVQPQVQIDPTQQAAVPDSVKELQRLANERQLEIYKRDEQLRQMQQQQAELLQRLNPQQQQQDVNPYDYQTNFPQWNAWEINKAIRDNTQVVRQEFNGMIAQAREMTWQQQHPDVSIDNIKLFNRNNGIAEWNLDLGYKLMNLPMTMQTQAAASSQQLLEQFRQNQTGAQPLRGAQTTGNPATGLSYEKLALDYQATNGRIYETWSPEIKAAFDQETNYRVMVERGERG